MQKLVREYLEELNKRQKKNRRVGIAIMLLAVLVIGGVAGILTQYGVAMTGKPKCGLEEHEHTDDCYEKVLTCGLEEGEGHIHTEECNLPKELTCGLEESEGHVHSEECKAPKELICGMEESEGDEEGHTHTDDCYSVPEGFICGLEASEGHAHTDDCYSIPEGFACGLEEGGAHTHGDDCYTEELICGLEEHEHTDICYTDAAADIEDASIWNAMYENVEWKGIWSEDLVTVAQMQLGYRESIENYQVAESGLRKGYTRYGHFVGEVYADWDAAFVNFCMFYAGMKSVEPAIFTDVIDSELWCDEFVKVREENAQYLTGPEGYVPVVGDIVFFQRENEETPCQMGIVSLVDEEKGELSVIEGNSQNEVKENVYAISDEYIVRYLKISELEAAYKNLENPEDVEDTENEEPEEEIVELSAVVDGVTITLSGPKSSFEADKKYSIQAEKVKDEGTIAAIEEAIANIDEIAPAETVAMPEELTADEEAVAASEEPKADEGAATEAEEPASEESAADEEVVATAKEPQAIDGEAAVSGESDADETEQQTKEVKSYQAFDIKLICDGEEVQPIGPVSVKFSGQEVADSVEDAETEVKVIHMDEATGEATDMEAIATEESDVVIETNHFSVYVYVLLEDLDGKINVTVQHWGMGIQTIAGTAVAITGEDNIFDTSKAEVTNQYKDCEIYSSDTLEIPNEYYADINNLSKVCNVPTNEMNYKVSEVWVCKPEYVSINKTAEEWEEGTYERYTADANLEGENAIRLNGDSNGNSLIRFWYIPKTGDDQFTTQARFYDYDISDGKVYTKTKGDYRLREEPSGDFIMYPDADKLVEILDSKNASDGVWYQINYEGSIGWMRYDGLTKILYLKTQERGINASAFTTNSNNKLGIGQQASGNLSDWTTTSTMETVNGKTKFLNAFNGDDNAIVEGIVKDNLTTDGKLQFNVAAPRNLFDTESLENSNSGSTRYDYQVKFKQNGDTYTLQHVYDGGTPLTGDLTKFDEYNKYIPETYYANGNLIKSFPAVYSNNFWPMDHATYNADPIMGKKQFQYRFLYDNGKSLDSIKKDSPRPSDDSKEHNWHFGMEYEVRFKVGDYTGPMEYYFRGDDDFWLFIDGKLAVDIGGIHSSVGESLNLREWMENEGMLTDKEEWHTMKVFYMERGGFGSCCYMQFTVPNSKPVTLPTLPKVNYTVRKEWQDADNPYRPGSITVELQQIGENGVVRDAKKTVELNAGNKWTHTWTGLPEKNGISQSNYIYQYRVKEIDVPGYKSELVGGVLTNTLLGVKVKVKKEWKNDEDLKAKYRPSSVTLRLFTDKGEYRDAKDKCKDIELNESNHWMGEFDNLPEFDSDGQKITYSVREMVGDTPIENGGFIDGLNDAKYQVSYSSNTNDAIDNEDGVDNESDSDDEDKCIASVTVTNTLLKSFQILKKDRVGEQETGNFVEGAEFALTSYNIETGEETGDKEYTGLSDTNGIIRWQEKQKVRLLRNSDSAVPAVGTYLMKEIKAPVGYLLSTEEWIVTVNADGSASITKKDGEKVAVSISPSSDGRIVTYTFEFYNEILYELPDTGGSGIYWYIFSGLLLMAASLILYKKQNRGVLMK